MGTMKPTTNKGSVTKRRVTFQQIEIIELPYTIGDGPSSGVPVSVDWIAQDRTRFRVDFFEQYRPQRRTKDQLRLSADARTHLLLRSGYSLDEITAGARDAQLLRKCRHTTLQQLFTLTELRSFHKSRQPRKCSDVRKRPSARNQALILPARSA